MFLVAPNTTSERIRNISELAGGLIYAVSILGVTGNDLSSKDALESYLIRVRENSAAPFVVGFGISTREDVLWFNQYADGVVVGSAILKNMDGKDDIFQTTKEFIQTLKGIT